ncbi:MAG TPA: amidase family protein, partial [Rariglobus sp.]
MKPQLTFEEWQAMEPSEVARLVHVKAAGLRPGQRKAVFAMLACEEEIAGRLARGTGKSELAGLPFVVKDVFDAADWPTRAGATFLDQVRPVPKADGALVARMRTEGAVLAGKTHLHEFAYGITGENPHYGDVEHPALPGRTSGGSSSGSAAAVAAGV